MIRAVIIDLDDTLCLTEAACFDLENETLVAMGRKPMERAVHLSTWGRPLFDAILDRSPGIDVEAFRVAYQPLISAAIENRRLDVIPDENLEALDTLAKMGKALVVLTSREHTELAHMLEKDHVLATRIERFYYKDNMQYHKPDPRAFEHIEAAHGWRPEECVYIGDSVGDAASAAGAGLHFIASLESGLRKREDFSQYTVAGFIQRFPEVVASVESLDKTL